MTHLEEVEMATFAARYGITPKAAIALPSIFAKIVEVSGRPLRSLIAEATYRNPELAQYIKGLAFEVTANL